MICLPVYNTEAEIPDAFKNEFVKGADGKFRLKEDAIPGAAEHFNPGLAANRDRALTQKQAAETRAQTAEAQAAEARRELEAARAPGAVVLTPEQAREWQRLSSLGVEAKEVEKIVKTEYPRLKAADELAGRQKAWAKAVEQLQPFGVSLNLEALSDLMTHPQRGAGLEIEARPVEVDNGNGGRVTVNLPHIVERVKAASGKEGEFEMKATFLLNYAADNWPAWAVQALTTPAAGGDGSQAGAGGFGQAGGGGGDASGRNLLPLSTGNNAGGGNGSTAAGNLQLGGGQFGSLKLPGQTGGGGLKLPAMGAGGGSTGGGTGGGGTVNNNDVAAQFNQRRDGGRVSPLQRGGGGSSTAGGQQQQQQQQR